jgi:hypothetical protein
MVECAYGLSRAEPCGAQQGEQMQLHSLWRWAGPIVVSGVLARGNAGRVRGGVWATPDDQMRLVVFPAMPSGAWSKRWV